MAAGAWGVRESTDGTMQAKLVPVSTKLGTEGAYLRRIVQEPDTFEVTDSSLVPHSCGENGMT